jgi:hypothetical protein
MATISLLNLDATLPVEDAYHSLNSAGIVRFLNASDANQLPALQRYMGDTVHRSTLLESKINEIILSFNLNPNLSSFDDSLFALVDGSHAFTAPISGVAPTASNHLATKSYVDSSDSIVQSQIQGALDAVQDVEASLPLVMKSVWTEYEWMAGSKSHVTLTLSPIPTDVSDIVSIVVMERLNIGTIGLPNYVYVPLLHGQNTNFKLDAVWIDDSAPEVVNVLIPNEANYPSGYPDESGYIALQVPTERHLRAIVTQATGFCDVVV